MLRVEAVKKSFDGFLYIQTTNSQGQVIKDLINIQSEMNNLIQDLSVIRDEAIPIKLILPIVDNDTGDYLIQSFTYTIPEGRSNYIPFTMTFTEFRQKGVQQAAVNLVNFDASETFKQTLISRRALDG